MSKSLFSPSGFSGILWANDKHNTHTRVNETLIMRRYNNTLCNLCIRFYDLESRFVNLNSCVNKSNLHVLTAQAPDLDWPSCRGPESPRVPSCREDNLEYTLLQSFWDDHIFNCKSKLLVISEYPGFNKVPFTWSGSWLPWKRLLSRVSSLTVKYLTLHGSS